MPKLFTSRFSTVALDRYPQHNHPSLQAFDAADEYLLNQLCSMQPPTNANILILNDQFGALSCSLAKHYNITSYGDSYLAEQALYNNLTTNQCSLNTVQFIPSTQLLRQNYDVVLIRVPKTLALLEEQLIRLQPHITEKTIILAGAMIKHLPRAAGELLEKYIGTVQALLAVKKARLLQITVTSKPLALSPYPTEYTLKEYKLSLINHANVFCRTGLDIGTRALLPHLPHSKTHQKVADLGCGNGILGILYAQQNPQAELLFIDESYMAIASAQENWQKIYPQRKATFQVSDGLIESPANTLDLILCNPPFHQQQTIGSFIANRMFQQSYHSLKSEGQLWVVFNRHLNYYPLLKILFGTVLNVAQTPKFNIIKAEKC